jgi:hypothetical protein
MTEDTVALSQEEAFELLAYLLASAHSCMYDPPGYGTYRLATAAERLAGAWAPRATGTLAQYLDELVRSVPRQSWEPVDNPPQTEAYLLERIAGLASEIKQRELGDRSDA